MEIYYKNSILKTSCSASFLRFNYGHKIIADWKLFFLLIQKQEIKISENMKFITHYINSNTELFRYLKLHVSHKNYKLFLKT